MGIACAWGKAKPSPNSRSFNQLNRRNGDAQSPALKNGRRRAIRAIALPSSLLKLGFPRFPSDSFAAPSYSLLRSLEKEPMQGRGVEKNETRSKKQEVTVTITPESPRQ